MTRQDRLAAAIATCSDRKLMHLLNREWWREFFMTEFAASTVNTEQRMVAIAVRDRVKEALQMLETKYQADSGSEDLKYLGTLMLRNVLEICEEAIKNHHA